ncbi:MAG TPA: MerR family transcriptional regulator [Roseiflexaceae bacterium]|nr:MerR family transcriptional regulator [Roseiflexaceae bacterium]
MSEETLYTISQLAEAAGVTPRTIRYYTAEGLLPRPDARGQYALYSQDHLLRLLLIGKLKQAYLPLGEIKARIEDLDSQQIRLLLEEYSGPATPAPSSAADYLAQVRARQLAPKQMAERAEPYRPERTSLSLRPSATPDAPAEPAPSSMGSGQSAAPVYGFAAPIAPPAAEARPTETPQQTGLLHKLIPPRRSADTSKSASAEPAPAPVESEQRWRRIVLAPGVELHVREPVAASVRERIEQLIAIARALFEIAD